MELGPLVFEPKLFPKIWGGRRLASWGKELPPQGGIGESWELYDRPEGSSRVARGPLRGRELSGLLREFGPRLAKSAGARFPLMVKLIDAQDDLSVQVHPGSGPSLEGKDECWVILEAEGDSRLVAGLKPGTEAKDLVAGDPAPLLLQWPARPGEVLMIPHGLMHAIGKGCLIYELQTNSDTTYRVYDYQRLENGKPRELHLKQALQCVELEMPVEGPKPMPPASPEALLLSCPYFKLSRLSLDASFAREAGPDFQILSCLRGSARLQAGSGTEELAKGETALVPASLAWSLLPQGGGAELLWGRP
jgi:mannose-6-phosphate isomerase